MKRSPPLKPMISKQPLRAFMLAQNQVEKDLGNICANRAWGRDQFQDSAKMCHECYWYQPLWPANWNRLQIGLYVIHSFPFLDLCVANVNFNGHAVMIVCCHQWFVSLPFKLDVNLCWLTGWNLIFGSLANSFWNGVREWVPKFLCWDIKRSATNGDLVGVLHFILPSCFWFKLLRCFKQQHHKSKLWVFYPVWS